MTPEPTPGLPQLLNGVEAFNDQGSAASPTKLPDEPEPLNVKPAVAGAVQAISKPGTVQITDAIPLAPVS